MLRRNMLFGDLFPTKSAICTFGVNSIECEIASVHYLWECADNNPITLVKRHAGWGVRMRVRAAAKGEIFSASMSLSFGFG